MIRVWPTVFALNHFRSAGRCHGSPPCRPMTPFSETAAMMDRVILENQKPETRNQKPETRNQKPESLYSAPSDVDRLFFGFWFLVSGFTRRWGRGWRDGGCSSPE